MNERQKNKKQKNVTREAWRPTPFQWSNPYGPTTLSAKLAALKALVGNAVVRRRRVSGAPLSEILARTPSLEKLWRTSFKIYILKRKGVVSIVCWFKTHEGRYRFIVSR